MKQLSRSTLWRRRRYPEASELGRERKGSNNAIRLLEATAQLVTSQGFAMRRSSNSLRYGGRSTDISNLETRGTSIEEALAAPRDEAFKWIRRKLRMAVTKGFDSWGTHIPVTEALLLVAAWDAFRPSSERRKTAGGGGQASQLNRIERAAIAALMADGVDEATARKEVEQATPRGEGWVLVFAQKMKVGESEAPSGRTGCPSKYLPISPRMVNYWRSHPGYEWAIYYVQGEARTLFGFSRFLPESIAATTNSLTQLRNTY